LTVARLPCLRTDRLAQAWRNLGHSKRRTSALVGRLTACTQSTPAQSAKLVSTWTVSPLIRHVQHTCTSDRDTATTESGPIILGVSLMIRRYCAFLLLMFPLFAIADKTKSSWKSPERPVYVVTQNHYAEGYTPEGNTAKFGDLIAIEIFNPRGSKAEENPVYKVGEHIALFVGGQRQGDVRIKKVMPLQCDSSAALVSTVPPFHLLKDTMALASNSAEIHPHSNSQRQASEAERNYARQLAMDEFRNHALPASLAKNIKIDKLVVTKLDDTNSEFLVGSLSLVTKSAGHEVFLIAKIIESAATAEFIRYHKTTDLEDGKDSEDVRFVDQLDLDGDGFDEIVVEVTGYENEKFAIYHRNNNSWTQVHLGGQGGC